MYTKISKNSKIARFYKLFDPNLPDTICAFTWTLLLFIVLFPLFVAYKIFCLIACIVIYLGQPASKLNNIRITVREFNEAFSEVSWGTRIVVGLLSGFIAAIFSVDQVSFNLILGLKRIAISIAGVTLFWYLVSLIIYLFDKWIIYYNERKYLSKAEYTPSKARVWWDNFMQRYCTKIDWED